MAGPRRRSVANSAVFATPNQAIATPFGQLMIFGFVGGVRALEDSDPIFIEYPLPSALDLGA
jgi:hypothetical protein